MDTVFDMMNTHAGTIGGYTRTQHVAITGANTINLKEKIVKKITMQSCITSFNPEELCSNDKNFFSFVGNWREQMQTLLQHFSSYYMHNKFMVVQVLQCQECNGTGALQFQVNGTGNPVLDASGIQIPLMENYVQEIGSLFDIWHNFDKLEVLSSCRIYFQHSKDVDHQNLAWSYELLMKNVDPSLQQHVISSCKNLPKYVFLGPCAFCLIAERIMSMTQNLAHNVNSDLLVISLHNFEGEDVMKCVFILRNVLRFLNFGITGFD